MTDFDWRRALAAFPLPLPDVRLSALHTALLVVDVQNVTVSPEGGLVQLLQAQHPEVAQYYCRRVNDVMLPTIAHLLTTFREHAWPVLFTTIGPELADGRDLPARRQRRDQRVMASGATTTAVRGSPGHAIPEGIAPWPEELVINKTTTSAFTSTGIDQTLRHLGITGLAVCGLATNACVEATARDAADRGYHTALIEDGCTALDQPSHDAALLSFSQYFGVVLTARELVDTLTRA